MPNILRHLVTRGYLCELADQMLDMGVVIAGFKLGEMGMYLRTGKGRTVLTISTSQH